MAHRFILLAAAFGTVLAAPAFAQSAKPAVVSPVDGLTRSARTLCRSDLKSVRCGDAQRKLVDAVRRQNANRTAGDISRSQIDALVDSFS